MFRLTQYMQQLLDPSPPRRRTRPGTVRPVVIWNLTRSCNLKCRHCYTVSADRPFPGELTHEQAMAVLRDLSDFRIPALILSGGEPMSRFDFWELAEEARRLDFRHLSLSTNGTRINAQNVDRLAGLGFDYVGISLDGIDAVNDWFRGVEGAFDQALAGVRACKAQGVKVGLRFTITEGNAHHLPAMLDLCRDEGVDKFYLSHLVYAGRGDKHRGEDTEHARTRRAMELLIARAWEAVERAEPLEVVTGNNDADAVYFLRWAETRFPPAAVAHLRAHLEAWGGNSSGLGVGNIDPQGKVHPDTYWSDYTLGSVKERPFSAIWTGDDPILATLRTRPRPLKGRCGACAYQAVCGGNTRIRALQLTGDPWAEDPACYLSGSEIGAEGADLDRLAVTPFRGKSHDPAHRFL
ncbi:heme d1 biosynthesis radical SAM protein NirJ [Paracoccus denitrificans]|jgi:heme d1 biosynthesis radical SAM protein NirJ|uniref:Pre-heme d1 synthase n=1 Tax=Paracoccus denitrificans (strain Pd 1222) TaxID=318586 RepID=A1B4Y7_PARDP|nr:heme d1 biosynthesis radical SAM protein NirJ [Paracoccus denitrificans]ABL70581.1 Radical SAM domain protein [Paracoccus denitrificans PD1222]MBB4627464.1 heme d1 biosynthesis radical SAM protein NirJ [Paracoccus denitrificans]MCU7429433.1 heme d1 biosynthesis radical SAM protein NirJ [Paracoccus denitrificans]QAR25914.1 heme d1 biosynthesis radical SAM protein NirJ [Paracoccus denitrificans]UPV94820.1 heme d1 biosynthesis radical SAM protein NirJ [Paracoccus denitrificans]